MCDCHQLAVYEFLRDYGLQLSALYNAYFNDDLIDETYRGNNNLITDLVETCEYFSGCAQGAFLTIRLFSDLHLPTNEAADRYIDIEDTDEIVPGYTYHFFSNDDIEMHYFTIVYDTCPMYIPSYGGTHHFIVKPILNPVRSLTRLLDLDTKLYNRLFEKHAGLEAQRRST